MDWTDIKPLADVAQWLVTVALAIAVWLRKPGEDAGKAVELLKAEFTGRVQLVDTKIATIEERVKHMPTSEELAELEGTVKGIGAQVDGIANGMRVQNVQLNRIEDFLLKSR